MKTEFFIALVAETKPHRPGPLERGECRQINTPEDFQKVMQFALEHIWSIEFFFSVYLSKRSGEVICIEDFRTLAEALVEWPDADVSRLKSATGLPVNFGSRACTVIP